MSIYQKMITDILAEYDLQNRYSPRHIEGYMRLAHSTLDGLSHAEFDEEVATAIEYIDYDGVANAESLAASFGL